MTFRKKKLGKICKAWPVRKKSLRTSYNTNDVGFINSVPVRMKAKSISLCSLPTYVWSIYDNVWQRSRQCLEFRHAIQNIVYSHVY